MQALTFDRYQVGRCGFEVKEEIICCPKWPTPVQTPSKLSNAFIDLSKQPEFENRPPPAGVISDSSIPSITSTPMNFNQNGNIFQEHIQDEEEILKVLFNGNFGPAGIGNNVGEWSGDSAPVLNRNNNIFFNGNSVPNIKNKQNLNGNPVVDENKRFEVIFGDNPIQFGNDNSQDEKKGNPFPEVNENNNGFIRADTVPYVQENQKFNSNIAIDENKRFKAIFGDNPIQVGNDNSQDEKKGNPFPVVNNNGFIRADTLPNVQENQNFNGNIAIDENKRFKAIFGDNPIQVGNDNSQDEKEGNPFPKVKENNTGFIMTNTVPNVQDNPVININGRGKSIFGDNPIQVGNDNSQDEKKGNPFPVVNNNGFIRADTVPNVQENQKFNSNIAIDENKRFKAIFGDNPIQVGNDNSQDEKKRIHFPVVNENNNRFIIADTVPNVQDNQNFNGNIAIDENKRFKAIFGDNPIQVGNDNSRDEKKGNPFPVVNNNGFIRADTLPNVQENQNFNGNIAIDENKRFKAIFGDNPIQVGNDNSQDEKKGNPFPVVNNNGFIRADTLPNIQENQKFNSNIAIDENKRFKAIFGDNPVQVKDVNSRDERKRNPVPLVRGKDTVFFNANPVAHVQENQNVNGNPVIDENERFNAIFNGNPLPIGDDMGRPNGVINQDPAENFNAKGNAILGGNLEQVSNGNNKEERKGNTVSGVNGNNNDFFSGNPVWNVQEIQKINGNPIIDENERFNSIFNGSPSQTGSVSSIGEWKRNSVPDIVGNNNGIFNANTIPNSQANIHTHGNPVIDENKKFKNDKGRLNGVISQNPGIFAGNGQLESNREHFIFNDKPLRVRPPNERTHDTIMESRNSFNN
ncbi:myb-like protein D isoform X2 [Bactrocera oleae]